jgi:transposase
MARAGRPALGLQLTDEIRAELERRVRAETTARRDTRRARVILACAEYGSARAAARAAGVAESTVRRWRSRFLRRGLEGMADAPRPGHAPSIGPVARLEVIATACAPAPREQGLNGWTLDRLCEEVVRRQIVPSIGRSTVHRILQDADLKPHRVRGWLHSPDPQFREKVTEICDLYLHPSPGSVVLCIDEKTGMQATERKHPDRPAQPGRLPRREFEYIRHGTQSLIAALPVHGGRVTACCGDTRTAEDLERFMEQVAADHPDGPVHVVWDNLNIHHGERWQRFNERHAGRFHFHYTPLHASWVNQVELFFAILQAKCLRHGSFRSTAELREAVLAFVALWNERLGRPFRWTFTGYPLQTGMDRLEAA